jgi:hypothetical protein
MATKDVMKLLVVAATEDEILDSIVIANRISGIDYPSISPKNDGQESSLTSLFTKSASLKSSPLRILEMTVDDMDIQVWHVFDVQEFKDKAIPILCLMESVGLIIVSESPPLDFLETHNAYFSNIDYPILWFMNKSKVSGSLEQKRQVIQKEAALSPLNVTKVTYTNAEDSVLGVEFGHWLMKVHSYSNDRRS